MNVNSKNAEVVRVLYTHNTLYESQNDRNRQKGSTMRVGRKGKTKESWEQPVFVKRGGKTREEEAP